MIQETMGFHCFQDQFWRLPVDFPLNQSIDDCMVKYG